MKRQERKIGSLRLIRYGVALILVLALASCQDLSLFIDHLDDEVKLANDRYLEVEWVYPEQNDQEVNPNVPLLINFDRPVNPDLVENWLDITIQNSIGENDNFVKDLGGFLTYSVDEYGTLTVNTSPFLTGGTKVIVSLTNGLPGGDGSILRDPRSWSFYTGRLPAGDLILLDGTNGADPGFSNEIGIATITAQYLDMDAEHYKVSENKTDLDIGNPLPWVDIPVKGTTKLLPLTYDLFSDPDGPKSLYIRFKDNDRNFSPIIEATTILDTLAPSLKPYFKGSGTTNKSAIVIAGAEDVNGIKTYAWDEDIVPAEKSLVFGTSSSDSTTVYPDTQPSIEKQYTIKVTAVDKAGNPGSTTIKLNWDKFVATPTVDFDTKHFLSEDIIEFIPNNINPVVHLVYDDRPWSLPFSWYLEEKDVPNEDLAGFLIGVNDYQVEKYFYDFYFDKDISRWTSKDIPIFEYYPDVEALMPGYYKIKFLVSDKLGNLSAEDTEYISYVSPRFRDIVNSGKDAWPHRVSNVNRYPSFAWPPDPERLVKNKPGMYYYKLYVDDPKEKDPVEIINDVRQKPYWYHTGPDDLPELSPGEKIYWWYEVWDYGPDKILYNGDDTSVYQSNKDIGLFEFKTGLF